MRARAAALLISVIWFCSTAAKAARNPFVGSWDFTRDAGANWLDVKEKNGRLEVWFQATGGHVVQLRDVRLSGSHLTLEVSAASGRAAATTWELDAAEGKLTGVEKQGDKTEPLTGLPAPSLKRKAPAAWSTPESLFNGRDLSGWEPIGRANSHWIVKNGVMRNEEKGANLKTTKTFEDFKVHFEVKCPDNGNSGFYLRGRYEVQLEFVEVGSEPPEREMGSIYGRIAPQVRLPRKPGEWESFDITLVGRTVTVIRKGVTVIDRKKIEGITGDALDAREGEPGPFYIQGDHSGGLEFRDIKVSTPKL